MKPVHYPCGPAANESELKAIEHLKRMLQSEPGGQEWLLLTNLSFSVTHQLQSDEIDIVAVGPPGVQILEVKHWTTTWVNAHKDLVEQEADRITYKARKIGTTLRKFFPQLPRVDGVIFLTQDPSKVKALSGMEVRGVQFRTLIEWRDALNLGASEVFSPQEVRRLGHVLEPKSAMATEGRLRRLAGYVNLELQTAQDERFHRVYKGNHPARRDRVVLHLYDLSAIDDKSAETKAKREFEALIRLQLYSWAPRILDSYQPVPGYAGEMYFFTLVDPAAPCLEERESDKVWPPRGRLEFARNCVRALKELHCAGERGEPIVHRNLTPRTILVKHDNTPIFTGFERARVPFEQSVASSSLPETDDPLIVAPEVRTLGLTAADSRSDGYSLCASLARLFKGLEDDLSRRSLEVLSRGLHEEPDQRAELQELETRLSELLGESVPLPAPPPARYWTEDQIVRFRERDYRIVSRLGSGGVGITFKVVEIDRTTKEELGTYVAKVAHERETGQRVLKAYSLVRSHLGRHTGLSTIFEVAKEWRENDLIALMTWVEGAPLCDYIGVFPLLADEHQELSSETLALRWLRAMCEALDVLHRNGLIHGDVSPRNMIVSGTDIVLTDYDFVSKIGEPIVAPGTIIYSSPSREEKLPACPADDLYALAASFFHVVFEREPFYYSGELNKKRGLNWEGIDRSEYPILAPFLDKATHPDPTQRFANAAEALRALQTPEVTSMDETKIIPIATVLQEERIEWLRWLLQSYPGSRWGNPETRGLDTEFAERTYVPTMLEETLLRDIRERRIRLVILCGNAGDGKTALLQHLSVQLGLGKHKSAQRIIEGITEDGLIVRMHLDGSAAWRGRSADDLLDEFLAPFQDGAPDEDIVHLLAVNDGRLLEWIEHAEALRGENETPLTKALYELLQREAAAQESFIRFINLNQRSLVGGIMPDGQQIETGFLNRLIDQLYGGDKASEIWSPCRSCSAKERCEVFRAARIFGPDGVPEIAEQAIRARARQRLFEALQAIHLRGETHITVRELRAALAYILFGIHFCDDYHGAIDRAPLPYWDRAFAPDSPGRQGEVLRELLQFDPALEAHPQIDRHLVSQPLIDDSKTAPRYPELSLASARRRAYFEWTPDDIEQIAGDPGALDLARGQHLRLFRNLPLMTDPERAMLCERLCGGISRLEDLPPQALDRTGVVPLRVTPRTPTETAFWVEKPLSSFRLEADLPPETEGVERLHRRAYLIYQYRDGHEERLRLGADLFHLLLELHDGYQLGDISTDDTFAHLSIFVQRLVREDERHLLAWNPMQDEVIYQVSTALPNSESGSRQRLVLTPLSSGGES